MPIRQKFPRSKFYFIRYLTSHLFGQVYFSNWTEWTGPDCVSDLLAVTGLIFLDEVWT